MDRKHRRRRPASRPPKLPKGRRRRWCLALSLPLSHTLFSCFFHLRPFSFLPLSLALPPSFSRFVVFFLPASLVSSFLPAVINNQPTKKGPSHWASSPPVVFSCLRPSSVWRSSSYSAACTLEAMRPDPCGRPQASSADESAHTRATRRTKDKKTTGREEGATANPHPHPPCHCIYFLSPLSPLVFSSLLALRLPARASPGRRCALLVRCPHCLSRRRHRGSVHFSNSKEPARTPAPRPQPSAQTKQEGRPSPILTPRRIMSDTTLQWKIANTYIQA